MRVVLLILLVAPLGLQSDAAAPAAVARLIEQELTAGGVPGAAVAVVSGDDAFAGSFGVADVENRTPMTAATLLQAGSLTKLFTALALTATLESRHLPDDTPIGRVMTGLGPQASSVTFHQLLTQTSGLRDRAGNDGSADEAALAAAARGLVASDFILPAGLVSYSNLGYALAGAGLEALRKQRYAEALEEAALAPLGMTQSTLRPADALARPHAVGHRLDGAAAVSLRTPANDTRIWPAGYLWTNATDMARAVSALVSGGKVAGQKGLPSSVIARVSMPHTPMPNIFVGGHYGYGLMIARDRGTLIHEHGGTMPGFSAMLRLAPDRRFGIAILANLDNAPLRRIAQSVMTHALGMPAPALPARQETPVTADQLKGQLGRYQNRGTADLTVTEGRVGLSLDGGPLYAVTRIGENRYLARPKPEIAGPEFVLQPGVNGNPPYLHIALWAYAKQ